jgi:hypothetical protein
MKAALESLTDNRIQQLLINDTQEEGYREYVNIDSTKEIAQLIQEKHSQLSLLPRRHRLGAKPNKKQLTEISEKLLSMATDHFGYYIGRTNTEFSSMPKDVLKKLRRSPGLRILAFALATACGAIQIENFGAPIVYAPITCLGLTGLIHTIRNYGTIKDGPFINQRTTKIKKGPREILIPKLAYNIIQSLTDNWPTTYSGLRYGIARDFERHVATEFAEKENNPHFKRNIILSDKRDLQTCYDWLTDRGRTDVKAAGSTLLQICEKSGEAAKETFKRGLDHKKIFQRPKRAGATRPKGRNYLDKFYPKD